MRGAVKAILAAVLFTAAASPGCIRTPNVENPVSYQIVDSQSVFEQPVYTLLELLDFFPSDDYSTLTSLYVDDAAGSNDNDGSATAPFKTIQKGINSASKGTIIRVKTGTYNEFLRFSKNGSKAAPIVVYAEDGAGTVVLDGKGASKPMIEFSQVKYIVIDGLEITNSNDEGILFSRNSDLFVTTKRYITVRNCKIHNVNGDAIIAHQSDYLLFEGNELYSVGTDSAVKQLLELVGVYHAVVKDNILRSNRGTAGLTRGGSTNIYWVSNEFRDFTNSEFGIEVGGRTSIGNFRGKNPFDNPEAYRVTLFNNWFNDVKKEAIVFQSAQKTRILHNTFINTSYDTSSSDGFFYFLEVINPAELATKDLVFRGNLVYNDNSHTFRKVYKSNDRNTKSINIDQNIFFSAATTIKSSDFTNPGGLGSNSIAEPVFVGELDNWSLDTGSPGKDCNEKYISQITEDYFDTARDGTDGIDCGAFETAAGVLSGL